MPADSAICTILIVGVNPPTQIISGWKISIIPLDAAWKKGYTVYQCSPVAKVSEGILDLNISYWVILSDINASSIHFNLYGFNLSDNLTVLSISKLNQQSNINSESYPIKSLVSDISFSILFNPLIPSLGPQEANLLKLSKPSSFNHSVLLELAYIGNFSVIDPPTSSYTGFSNSFPLRSHIAKSTALRARAEKEFAPTGDKVLDIISNNFSDSKTFLPIMLGAR